MKINWTHGSNMKATKKADAHDAKKHGGSALQDQATHGSHVGS